MLAVAELAGIMGAKRTAELIPLCHPIALTDIGVEITPDRKASALRITAHAATTGPTGVEMEALTAASIAALTAYDMLKSADRGISIEGLRLVEKRGGKSGVWQRTEDREGVRAPSRARTDRVGGRSPSDRRRPHDDRRHRRALVLTISDGVTAGTRDRRERRAPRGAPGRARLRGRRAPSRPTSPTRSPRSSDAPPTAGTRLIVTTGGTGLGPRDRTPEAVTPIVDYVIPGFGEAMRAVGRESTPMASLSRSFGAVRGRTLILCLPGSPRGALESLAAVEPLLEHSLEMLAGRTAHAPDAAVPTRHVSAIRA